jgi:lysophospholipase L1-like esterase
MALPSIRPPREAPQPRPITLALARTCLAPLLKAQGLLLRRRAPRLPEAGGLRHGVVGEGPIRLRMLVVGDSSAAGVGVRTQDEALAPQLARAVADNLSATSQRAGRGSVAVSWQLVAAIGLTANQALTAMAATKLYPADLLVTVLGVNDVINGTPPADWLQDLDAIRGHARHRAKVRHTVHCAPPRMDLMTVFPQPLRWVLGAGAERLDAALRRHVRQAHRRSRFVLPFDPSREDPREWLAADGFHPNAALYRRWASELADHIDLDLSQSHLSRAVLPSSFHGTGAGALDPLSGYSGLGELT